MSPIRAIGLLASLVLVLGCVVRSGPRHPENSVGAPRTNGRPFDAWFAENVQVGMPRGQAVDALVGTGLICWNVGDDAVECSFVDDGPPSRYRRIELVFNRGQLAKIVRDDGDSAVTATTE